MKRLLVLPCLVFVGCATSPDAIPRGLDISLQGMNSLQQDVTVVVDAYKERLYDQYEARLMQWFETTASQLTNENGEVDKEKYNQLMMNYAQRMREIEANLEADASKVKNRLNAKIGIVKEINTLVEAYQNAKGIPPEKFDELVNASIGLLETTKEEIDKRDTDSDGQADEDLNFGDVIQEIGERSYERLLQNLATQNENNNQQ